MDSQVCIREISCVELKCLTYIYLKIAVLIVASSYNIKLLSLWCFIPTVKHLPSITDLKISSAKDLLPRDWWLGHFPSRYRNLFFILFLEATTNLFKRWDQDFFLALSWLLGTYYPCWITLLSLDEAGGTWSCLNLTYCLFFKSMGGMTLSRCRQRRSGWRSG